MMVHRVVVAVAAFLAPIVVAWSATSVDGNYGDNTDLSEVFDTVERRLWHGDVPDLRGGPLRRHGRRCSRRG